MGHLIGYVTFERHLDLLNQHVGKKKETSYHFPGKRCAIIQASIPSLQYLTEGLRNYVKHGLQEPLIGFCEPWLYWANLYMSSLLDSLQTVPCSLEGNTR